MLGTSVAAAVENDPADDGSGGTGDSQLRLVRLMMWTALGLIMAIRLLSALQEGLAWSVAFVTMAPYPPLVALLAGPRRLRVRNGLLAALVMLYAVPFAVAGTHWDWLPWPLAVAALCFFPGRVAWPLFGLILVATDVAGMWAGDGALGAITRTLKTADDGLIIFGLYALVAMVARLDAARGDLARLELLRERLRVDGELRTVVGAHLRAASVRLAQAVDAEPKIARDRLGAAVETVRQALTDIRATAADYRVSPAPPAPIESPRVARLTLAAVFVCDASLQLVGAVQTYHRPWTLLLLAPLICAAGVVLLLMKPSRRQLILLGLLVGVPAMPFGYLLWELSAIANLWPFFLGLVLTRMRPPRSLVITGVAVALYITFFFYPPPVPNLAGMAGFLVSMAILTWVSYGLIRLSNLVVLLHQAQRDLTREALIRERTRIARDLHDLLSFSLSAVALRGELCERLMETDPVRARTELTALPDLVERALTELESVAHAAVGLRLDQELTTAHAVLEAAGIQAATTVETGTLSPEVDAAIAAVLREAVTNVVRHSTARTCLITVTPEGPAVRLRVVNDGAADPPPATPEPGPGGSGLTGLAERTGGRLTAGTRAGGRFELVAEFATDPISAPGPAPLDLAPENGPHLRL
ncbi:histidine kinase [Actinoallomurus purpureus]|uniref:sensor histidine kinase n=1 Tax=Actinoallomurus purpureus TaxID=478114 RepID=UPI0020933732|nr:histidine kinase [Actinoallomurus purpureus]MCO6008247.1 histidine kinase [Actinoallomurus purpureus]